jgi:hypothetical protein
VEGLTNKQGEKLPAQTTCGERVRVDVRGKRTDTLGRHRGQALAEFLHQMKEHNAGVVRASSDEKHSTVRPAAKATRAFARKP